MINLTPDGYEWLHENEESPKQQGGKIRLFLAFLSAILVYGGIGVILVLAVIRGQV